MDKISEFDYDSDITKKFKLFLKKKFTEKEIENILIRIKDTSLSLFDLTIIGLFYLESQQIKEKILKETDLLL